MVQPGFLNLFALSIPFFHSQALEPMASMRSCGSLAAGNKALLAVKAEPEDEKERKKQARSWKMSSYQKVYLGLLWELAAQKQWVTGSEKTFTPYGITHISHWFFMAINHGKHTHGWRLCWLNWPNWRRHPTLMRSLVIHTYWIQRQHIQWSFLLYLQGMDDDTQPVP